MIPDQESSEESNYDEVVNLEPGQIKHYPANEDLPEVFEERLRKLDLLVFGIVPIVLLT